MKTTKTLLCMAALLAAMATYAQVGIGTNTPDPSAALQIESTDKGIILPRVTKEQMEAIANPALGLLVFCTDCEPVGVYQNKQEGNSNFIPQGWIGKYPPDPSAVLEFNTNSKGLLIPTMNSFRMYEIENPALGLLIFCTDCDPVGIYYNATDQSNNFRSMIDGFPTGIDEGDSFIEHESRVYLEVTGPSGRVWLDRNLGASRVPSTHDDTGYTTQGYLFQFGRESDGHELQLTQSNLPNVTGPIPQGEVRDETSANWGNYVYMPAADPGVNDDILARDTWWTEVLTDPDPGTPINEAEVGNNNYFKRWNKGTEEAPEKREIYDPCPEGYRVPTYTEFLAEFAGYENDPDAYINFFDNTELKLIRTGVRTNRGVRQNVGERAMYWTSSTEEHLNSGEIRGKTLMIFSHQVGNNEAGTTDPVPGENIGLITNDRHLKGVTLGAAVRCIKD